jgi:hypothetical protein
MRTRAITNANKSPMKSGPPPSKSEQTSFPITNASCSLLQNGRGKKEAPEIREGITFLLKTWKSTQTSKTVCAFIFSRRFLEHILFYIKIIFYEVSQTMNEVVGCICRLYMTIDSNEKRGRPWPQADSFIYFSKMTPQVYVVQSYWFPQSFLR